MTIRILILLSAFLPSCKERPADSWDNANASQTADSITYNPIQTDKLADVHMTAPSDTASIEYLQYLIKADKDLNDLWVKKLKNVNAYWLENDQYSAIDIKHIWKINDTISAMILNHTTGVSYDDYILTFNDREDFIAKLKISDQDDRDLSAEWYTYTEYRFLSDKEIELSIYELKGHEDNEHETVERENWTIQENGQISRTK
jgi:hypothetical protein